MEGEGVEPDAVAGAAEAVGFLCGEQASVSAGVATPFEARVEGCPFLGDAAYFDKAGEQGEGLWGEGAGEVGRLGGVVSGDEGGVCEGAVLCFERLVGGWEAVVREDGVEVFAGGS